MKWLLFIVLGLLTSCTEIEFQGDDMNQGNPQYAKSGGWSGGGKLINDGVSNVACAADFLAARVHNEIPSKNYTVQFNVTLPPGGVFANPVAEISWSVEGNTIRRLVSVTNGCSVTGVGQGVKVVVRDQTPQGIGGKVYGVSYDVAITVAPGNRSSVNQPPIFTPPSAILAGAVVLPLYTVPPLSFLRVAIPQNAGVISSYVTAVTADGSPLTQFGGIVTEFDVAGHAQKSYDVLNQEFVPISGQGFELQVFNNLAAGHDLQVSVSFGIDG